MQLLFSSHFFISVIFSYLSSILFSFFFFVPAFFSSAFPQFFLLFFCVCSLFLRCRLVNTILDAIFWLCYSRFISHPHDIYREKKKSPGDLFVVVVPPWSFPFTVPVPFFFILFEFSNSVWVPLNWLWWWWWWVTFLFLFLTGNLYKKWVLCCYTHIYRMWWGGKSPSVLFNTFFYLYRQQHYGVLLLMMKE